MTLMLSVSGCRGIMGTSLTPEVASRYAAAFASFLKARAGGKEVTVVLGRDGRVGGHVLHQAAMAGLLGAGVHVRDLGIVMTPTVAVATDRAASNWVNDVFAGMVLTASHNPQEWNGLKCLLAEGGANGLHASAACAPAPLHAEEIMKRFRETNVQYAPWDRLGEVTFDESAESMHVDRVLRAMEDVGCGPVELLGDGLSVVVDSVNASGVAGAALAMEAMGVSEFLHLGAEDTGIFPHPPEPTATNLSLKGGLCDVVKEEGADVGFAQDPDADRLAIVDERGQYIGEEYTLALGALAILEAEKRSGRPTQGQVFVTNLSTSRMLDDVCARFGASVVRTAVGEANVVETMKSLKALGGGEGNGGVIWPRVAYVRDSISAMALVMWLIKGNGTKRKLSEIVASIPSYAIHKRKVDLASKDQAVGAVEKIAAAFASEHVDRTDGVWVNFTSKRSWLHVRASNTEPIMRLIAEAPTPAEADAILDEAQRLIG